MITHDSGDTLEGHYRIERGNFDSDHSLQRQDLVERLRVVVYAAGSFVQVKRDHRQLCAELLVIRDGILFGRKREQRIRATALGVAGHLRRIRAGHNDFVRECPAPRVEHGLPL